MTEEQTFLETEAREMEESKDEDLTGVVGAVKKEK